MHKSRLADSKLPKSEVADGMSVVQKTVGPKISRHRSRARTKTGAPTEAIVPITGGLADVRASTSAGRAKTVEWIEPRHAEALQVRTDKIDRSYGGGDLEIETDLPEQVVRMTFDWLRANNLIWSSNDPAFWRALDYVLGSLESFSVDAVEQALIICTTEAFNDPARRTTIFQELKACRAIKKIRDLQLKIRTARVVAERSLSAPYVARFAARDRKVEEDYAFVINAIQKNEQNRSATDANEAQACAKKVYGAYRNGEINNGGEVEACLNSVLAAFIEHRKAEFDFLDRRLNRACQ
jgi:hypothetical protein